MEMWTPLSIFLIPIGTLAGIIFGALPGFSASTGIALLMPVTFVMSPFEGLTFLICIYAGSIYGGAIPAILLSIPGAPGSAAQLFDGYPMAQKGMPMEALAINTTSSMVGSCISIIAFLTIAPALARVALNFGPPEMFWVAVWGLTAIVALEPNRIVKGLFAGCLGMLFGAIGADPMFAYPRMFLGILELYQGVPFIPALVGLFCFSEMILGLNKALSTSQQYDSIKLEVKKLLDGVIVTFRYPWELIRSSIIGTVVGILPGAGASVAAFLAYTQSRLTSKHPEKYGTGIPEGIISTGTADNATMGGALIPLMTLGVPGSAATAILLGLLMYHGLRPGPKLFLEQWPLIKNLGIAAFVGSLLMGVLGLIFARYCAEILKVDTRIIAPATIILATLAAISSSGSIVDIYIMIFFGLLGIVMKVYKYPITSMVLGLILGPLAETNLLQALRMNQGSPSILFTRPLSIFLIGLCIVSFLYPYMNMKKGFETKNKKATV